MNICAECAAKNQQLRKAEDERDAAVAWIGVVRDELTRAGWPAGDRAVALANLRGLLSWWSADVDSDIVAERYRAALEAAHGVLGDFTLPLGRRVDDAYDIIDAALAETPEGTR